MEIDMRYLALAIIAASLWTGAASAQVQLVSLPSESVNYGVSPTNELRNGNYEAPTPLTVPGAVTVSTSQLGAMLGQTLVVDVHSNPGGQAAKNVIQGALWWPDAGLYGTTEDRRFAEQLAQATGSNKDRAVAFYCGGPTCWLSYNASLRAVHLGYRVYWYRGGSPAWKAAQGPVSRASAMP